LTMTAGQAFGSLDDNLAASAAYAQFQINSDYTQASLTTVNGRGVEYRIVASGLRIRYTGPELTRAGTIYAIEHPDHDTLNGMTLSELAQFESQFKCPVTRQWCTLSYTPVKSSEFTYGPDYYANGAGQTDGLQHFLGFHIFGGPASGAFEFETVILFEVIGHTVRDLKPAMADPNGLAAVMNVITPNAQKQLNDAGPGQILSNIVNGAKEISGVVSAISKAVSLT